MGMMVDNGRNWDAMYIHLRPQANIGLFKENLMGILKEFYAEPCEIGLFDEIIRKLYFKEQRLSLLISSFSFLAIFISIIGVFGLVIFESYSKRREIAIRKVYGSSIMEVLKMFNQKYIHVTLFCFVIASPIAWYIITVWLEQFTYRTPVYIWVFLAALAGVLSVTVLTVTVQSWKTATENPKDVIQEN